MDKKDMKTEAANLAEVLNRTNTSDKTWLIQCELERIYRMAVTDTKAAMAEACDRAFKKFD